VLTLYFADSSGRLYVPVQRRVTVENNQVARAAIRELIAGPRNGLTRLVLPDARLLDLQIGGGTATVNFDRRPTGAGDDRGFYAMTLTLTHFPTVQRVQFQVNGQNFGIGGSGPIARPTVNPLNPQNLPFDVSRTEFLPLYFVSADGTHDIRVIRMVPKTQQVAEATVRALLEGPGEYGSALQRVIPEGTELRGIRLENGTIIVDFTQPFASASNRAAAVRTVVESLTTLKTVSGVIFLVEGHSLADQWGGDYGRVFGRVVINPE
jgi:spore germination protein GerM